MKHLAIIATLAVALVLWRAWTQAHRRRFVAAFEFPEGLRRKLRQARPGLTPARLPLLFAVDEMLGIGDGFRYVPNCEPGAGNYCASHIGCGSGGDSGGGD